MKKTIFFIILAISILAILDAQRRTIENLKKDRDIYKANTKALLQRCATYQTQDGKNVAQANTLQMKVKALETYRAEDAQLIKQLQTKGRDLDNVTTAQSMTETPIKTIVRDSLIYIDRYKVDTLQCVKACDAWFTFEGCITDGEFNGTFINRDSLLVAVTTKYKKFLFWKIKKVKDQHVDIVSKNPHTKILGVEYINIYK